MIDQPDTSSEDIRDNLRDMAVINRWLGGTRAALVYALPLLKTCASNPIRILDAACGGCDLSRQIVKEARKLKKRVEITALDLNPKVLECAHEMSSSYPEITFVEADILNPPFGSCSFDIVILATFLHHLEPAEAISALRIAGNLSKGYVIVTDLERSQAAYIGFRIIARILHFSKVTIHDGAVSVYRAYTSAELGELANRADLTGWRLHRHLFYRITVIYKGAHATM